MLFARSSAYLALYPSCPFIIIAIVAAANAAIALGPARDRALAVAPTARPRSSVGVGTARTAHLQLQTRLQRCS